jgi:hypothetical protein
VPRCECEVLHRDARAGLFVVEVFIISPEAGQHPGRVVGVTDVARGARHAGSPQPQAPSPSHGRTHPVSRQRVHFMTSRSRECPRFPFEAPVRGTSARFIRADWSQRLTARQRRSSKRIPATSPNMTAGLSRMRAWVAGDDGCCGRGAALVPTWRALRDGIGLVAYRNRLSGELFGHVRTLSQSGWLVDGLAALAHAFRLGDPQPQPTARQRR